MKPQWTIAGLVLVSWGIIVSSAEANDPSSSVMSSAENLEFVFARVQFNSLSGRGYWRGRTPGWAHDYPRAEINFLKIISEVTSIRTSPDAFVVVQLDDPGIMDYPFLYFSEPGTWDITETEAQNLREYFNRGGFAVFDDFDGQRDWRVFESCMRRVFPERSIVELDVGDPIFHCFYDIETLDMVPPGTVRGGTPQFLAMRDDSGRIQAVINFNNDIGDFWEWSDQGFFPVHLSNEAYKLGINYIVYSLTH